MDFVCSAGRTLDEDFNWRIWDAKKQEWAIAKPNSAPENKEEIIARIKSRKKRVEENATS